MSEALWTLPWIEEVRRFWFEEIDSALWFRRDDALDAEVRKRFRALYGTLAADLDAASVPSAPAALAGAIVLDQFPRNMFRGTAMAFAADPKALAIARTAVGRGLDRRLAGNERLFLYLPFEHSEELADQERAVELIGALGDPELLRYAEAHRTIVAQFGRFPHRNAALGRASTPEEIAFLRQPGSSF